MTVLSIVIPAYNEEAGIDAIARRVLAVAGALKRIGIEDMELLVIDDGSTDRTAELAAGIDGVNLVQHPRNRGYGAALKTGFHAARGDLIGFLDADGTYPPEYFPELCLVALNGADLVIGSRMAGADSQMPITRRAGNHFFAALLSMLGRQQVSDSASGMRVFRREILERIYPLPDGLNLTPVMSTRAIHEGIKMAEVPIPYSERIGRSKLSVVNDGSLFLRSMLWTAMEYNPVRILGMIGLTGVAIGFFTLLALILARLSGITVLGEWGVIGVYAGAVAGIVGVNIFVLGIFFNSLISLVRGRPVRQGLFGKPIFQMPIDRHFGWIGMFCVLAGLLIIVVSIGLGIGSSEISRLWLYGLGSAVLIILGAQLIIYWLVLSVLDALVMQEIVPSSNSVQNQDDWRSTK